MEEPFLDDALTLNHSSATWRPAIPTISEGICKILIAVQTFRSSPLPGSGLRDLLQRAGCVPPRLRLNP